MDSFFKMVDVQTVLFIYMAVGFFCRKKGIFNDAARDKLTDFVVLITLPCMIFESFHMEFSLESLKQGGVAVLIATVMAAAALLLGKVLYNRFPYGEKSILQYGTLVTNSGFAGLPVVSGAYGDEGLFLGSLFIIPTRILMWSAGISLFTKADAKQAVRKVLLNPGIIAVEVGLVWMLFQLPLPHFVDTAVDNLGACTSPMAMALVGAILADVPPKTVFDPKCFYLVAVRQLLLPAVCLVALRPVFVKYRDRGKQEEPTHVGQTAVVVEDVDNEGLTGRVETDNRMTWAARSADGSFIPQGAVVRIVGQESVKLIVERKVS